MLLQSPVFWLPGVMGRKVSGEGMRLLSFRNTISLNPYDQNIFCVILFCAGYGFADNNTTLMSSLALLHH